MSRQVDRSNRLKLVPLVVFLGKDVGWGKRLSEKVSTLNDEMDTLR